MRSSLALLAFAVVGCKDPLLDEATARRLLEAERPPGNCTLELPVNQAQDCGPCASAETTCPGIPVLRRIGWITTECLQDRVSITPTPRLQQLMQEGAGFRGREQWSVAVGSEQLDSVWVTPHAQGARATWRISCAWNSRGRELRAAGMPSGGAISLPQDHDGITHFTRSNGRWQIAPTPGAQAPR